MTPDEDKVLEAMQARYLQIMRMRNSDQEKPVITVYPDEGYELPLKSVPEIRNRRNRGKRGN